VFSSPEGPGTGTLELAVGSSSDIIGTLDTIDPWNWNGTGGGFIFKRNRNT